MKKKCAVTSSVTGKPIAWRLWTPDNGKVRGLVQFVHGMAEHIDRYDGAAKALTDAGYAVIGHTHLGHGEVADILGYFGEKNGWQNLIDDVHAIRKKGQKLYPDVPYYLLGHSMGSFIVRCYMTEHATGVAGTILSGTGYFAPAIVGAGLTAANLVCLFGGAKKPSPLINQLAFSSSNKPFEPARTPFDWLSRDNAEVDKYVADPYCGFLFTGSGYRDMFRGLKRLNNVKAIANVPKDTPVLFFSGKNDPVGGKLGDGVMRVATQWRSAGLTRVETHLYEDGRHEMFNELNRVQVLRDLVQWLDMH